MPFVGVAVVGAANWSEMAQKLRAGDRDWVLSRALLLSYELTIESVTLADAEWAAGCWRRGEGLSLAGRLCLALTARRDDVVLTADRVWRGLDRVELIR